MANIRVFNPWSMIPSVWEDASAFVGTSLGHFPKAEMYEEDDKVHVQLEASGYKPEEIEISITGDTLKITGKSEEKKEEKNDGKKYYFSEISEKTFTRTFTLPYEVVAEEATADFTNGMLHLVMPKSERAVPKTVKVQAK